MTSVEKCHDMDPIGHGIRGVTCNFRIWFGLTLYILLVMRSLTLTETQPVVTPNDNHDKPTWILPRAWCCMFILIFHERWSEIKTNSITGQHSQITLCYPNFTFNQLIVCPKYKEPRSYINIATMTTGILWQEEPPMNTQSIAPPLLGEVWKSSLFS